ncbi:hypothetical protein IV203_013027 [Nitzschia inconspicua]|uniref:Uncharacterized protein n=1 Tax=Nitzschia inconspicua TaxID=303405 RepID=A0A9K3Q741_9STRA|nr:hypothetical protein IV203_013027 [Nitzschia inconspicua]
MAAFLIQNPTGKKEYEGGLNLDNVTEELLNGFFCHYEPPTSENAQFKAAREARAHPEKYSIRPVAKPILRTPTLHPKHQNGKGTSASSKLGSKSDAATVGPHGSAKSVTWRDEKTSNDRNKVEKEVVGCAANYCGIFQQGEGLTDVFMTPAEKAAAAKKAAAKQTSKKKKNTASDNSIVSTPKSSSSLASQASSMDESVGSNGTNKKRLTPILTSRNKKNRTDTPSSSTVNATPTAATASGRILYDDLGNPITESEVDEETVGFDESVPGTPASQASGRSMDDPPRTPSEGDVDTPTPEKAGATTMDSTNPLAFFYAVPTAVIGAAVSAAEAVGYKTSSTAKPATEAPSTPVVAAASPSILRRPAPSDTNSGVLAEYRDEIGMYEPEDYNNPFPNASRDPSNGLAYKRVRSPPARRRQPTPRRVRGMSERYEDELYDDDEHYTRQVMEDGEVVSSLGKVPRQKTGTIDTVAARQSRRHPAPRVYRGQDLSPSTITGATSYQYERDASGRRLRPAKSPGRRSDMYSDLTMEEEAYIYYQSPSNNAADEHNRGTQPRRRSRGDVVEEVEEEEARLDYVQERVIKEGRRNRGSDQYSRNSILDEDGDEEELSPRQYAERFGRKRWEGYCEPNEKVAVDTREDQEADNEIPENLSPRHYAEKYRERRTAETREKDTSDEISSGRNSSSSKKEKKSTSQSSKERRRSSGLDPAAGDSKRDPIPRKSVDPIEAGDAMKKKEPLPPTPRRNADGAEEVRSLKPTSSTPASQGSFDFSREALNKRRGISQDSPLNQFSPRSMATDDEIREEVSSVGMASETIRPLNYVNPFLNVPPAIIEDEEQNLPLDRIPSKEIGGLDPSTLSGSGSTLSSKPSTKSGRSSQRQTTRCENKAHPAIQKSFSGSTRSKKLWKGWKKTIGTVKKIVQDIDEQRIHPPQFGQTMNAKV